LSAMTSQNFTLKRIVLLLVSTQQSQNDMKGRNDAGDNIRHCRDCASLHCGNTAARNFRPVPVMTIMARPVDGKK
jgi:hypothetical protein